MRVMIATPRVPFTRGEPERLAVALHGAVTAAGHEADIMAMPFSPRSAAVIPDQLLSFRLMQLGESSGTPIDRLVALAFPATLVPHPARRFWLHGLYPPAYCEWDAGTGLLHDAPGGAHVRHAVHAADAASLGNVGAVYSTSHAASARLQAQAGVAATVLHEPPPDAGRFAWAEPEDYLLVPDAVLTAAVHGPVLDALAAMPAPVSTCLIGAFASPDDETALRQRGGACTWRGAAADRPAMFARCTAVLATDDGRGVLEAMLSGKPVIALPRASGLVADGETGLACAADGVADAVARLWADRAFAIRLGGAGRDAYGRLGIGWDRVLQSLLA